MSTSRLPVSSILTLCLGNICRSPMAEGLLRARFAEAGLDIRVDSAGTGGWHVGKPPDPRTIAAARRNGIDIAALRARRLSPEDFHRFDLILAMDADNHATALAMRPPDGAADVHLFLDYATGSRGDVPDPYYGGDDGFQAMFEMIDAAAAGLVQRLQAASG
jgi:protein-tyrosine phosphatase